MPESPGVRSFRNFKPDTRLATATTTKSGSTVTAMIDGVPTVIEVARDLTVAIGDVLPVVRFGSQWFALGRAYTTAPAAVENDTGPDPKPSVIYGTLAISPIDTGSWNGLAWRTDHTDVYQGIYGTSGNHIGAVFYGSKPTSLAGATVITATMAVRRVARGSTFGSLPTTMRLITDLSRPAGAPALSSTTTGPALAVNETDIDFGVPAAWVQAMVDGTAGGIGFYDADGSPFIAYAGRAAWSPAFTLTVEWSK